MSGAYRDRGFGGAAAEMDRKRIKDVLEKHLDRSSPSTSRGAAVAKERDRLAAAGGKLPAPLGKAGKVSDGGKDLVVCLFRARGCAVCFDGGWGWWRLVLHCLRSLPALVR